MGRDGDVYDKKCPKCGEDILYDVHGDFSYCTNDYCDYEPPNSYKKQRERREYFERVSKVLRK